MPELPTYVHLGLILDGDGKKMSKRHRADVLREAINQRFAACKTFEEEAALTLTLADAIGSARAKAR